MGYVKLNKAAISSGVPQFDVLLAEGVAMVKKVVNAGIDEIHVSYVGDTRVNKIVGSADFTDADVQAIVNAIGLIGGGSGMIDVMLSQVILSLTIV